MNANRTIRSICVVGDGMVGLTAALAFARALPMVSVSLIAAPADPAALADRLPSTLPPSRRFHAHIGIEERELVGRGIATHRLGTRYLGWSRDAASWVLPFGEVGLAADSVPFHQLWARARRDGHAEPFDRYALATRLGEAGKFVLPRHQRGSPLATIDYALRLDPDLYVALLRERVAQAGIERPTAPLATVERGGDGRVAALLLADGRRLAAELYIDCGGPRRLLAGADSWQSWAALQPFRAIALDFEGLEHGDPLDTVAAGPDGWTARFPLYGRTMRVTASAGDDRGDAVALSPGRLLAPWQGNVLAIGDAAIALDPLLPVHLTLAHNAIARALDLLPGRDCHPLELAEYNRLTREESDRVRDLAALFILRSGRSDAVWADCLGAHLPDSLALTLDQFEHRGRLPFFEHELIDSDGWLAILTGLGVQQRHVDPAALRIAPDAAAAAMARLVASHRDIAARALPYPAYLAQMRAAAAP